MTRSSFVSATFISLSIAVLPSIAKSQEEGPTQSWSMPQVRSTSVDVEGLIDRGIELRKQKRDEEALGVFRRAYMHSRTARPLTQMALAEQALGRWAAARQHLSESLEGEGDWIEERRELLEGELDKIESKLGRVEIGNAVEGAEVRLNNKRRGTLPLTEPLWVAPGTVVIDVRAEGFETVRRRVDVRAGATAREEIDMVPLQPPSPKQAAEAATDSPTETATALSPSSVNTNESTPRWKKWWVWTLVGAAAVGVAVAVGVTVPKQSTSMGQLAPSDIGGVVETLRAQ